MLSLRISGGWWRTAEEFTGVTSICNKDVMIQLSFLQFPLISSLLKDTSNLQCGVWSAGKAQDCADEKSYQYAESRLVQEHHPLPLEHPEGEDGEEEEEEVDEEVEAVHQVGLGLGKVSVHFHLTKLKC